jgi:hypothetical protein
MKSPHSSKINPSLFKQDTGEQPVRLIKASQVGKLLNGSANGHVHGAAHAGTEAHKKPEIRMIHSGGDYCDLEVICGCGESTQVRCWNTSPTEEKGVSK